MKRLLVVVVSLAFVTIFSFVSCSATAVTLWDVAAGLEVALRQVAPKMSQADIVYVGEMHDRTAHHRAQLEIIKAIRATGKPVAVGVEMFQHANQEVLDRWVAGQMAEEVFEREFNSNWGEMWPLYRDIFIYCRSEKIPMIGLNVPKEITSKVAREGFGALTPEEMSILPFVTCKVDPEYLELMRSAHGGHLSGVAFDRFCEAQLVWDTAMAVYSLEFLKRDPSRTVVVLAGYVHAWKKGIPVQVRKESPATSQLIVLPSVAGRLEKDSVSVADCDYLVLGL